MQGLFLKIFKSSNHEQLWEEEKVKATPSEALISYDIKRDVKDCPITATIEQLIKYNPLYMRQLKEMLAEKRRRTLSKVGLVADVRMLYEDHGST